MPDATISVNHNGGPCCHTERSSVGGLATSVMQQFVEADEFARCPRQLFDCVIVNRWARPCRHFDGRSPAHLPGNFCQGNRCHQTVVICEIGVRQLEVCKLNLPTES